MKNLKLLFAALVVLISISACAPNHEEISPSSEKKEDIEFHVKNTDGGAEGMDPTPGGE